MGRDKFASMAQAQAQAQVQAQTVAAAPRRDKFAAVEQRQRLDSLNRQRETLIARCHQRDAVWEDIATAEAAVTKLLDLAAKTVDQLAENTTSLSNPNEDLLEIQTSYQETVAEIHKLLSPHSGLVEAYKAPTHINRMYVQRVEHRLAESRLELMQELLSQEGVSTDTTTEVPAPAGKRKREE